MQLRFSSTGRDVTSRSVKVIGPPSLSPVAIAGHLRDLGSYVDLLLTLTHHRIRVRYKQSALGLGWALVQPIALMLIYTVIFSVVTRMPSDGAPYALFVFSALLPWTFFSGAVSSSANGLVSHTHLITKVYFPREILPISYVLAGLFDFCVASVVLAGMMVYHRTPLTLYALWAAPIMLIAVVFTTSLALALSALQVRIRDVGLAIPLLMQVWTFASPVVYPLSQVPARMLWWYSLNPMAGVVENFRRVVVLGMPPDSASLTTAAIVSFALLPVAYMIFKLTESTMADVI